MPEDIEIDTDTLRETIDAEVEKAEDGSLLRWIALSTSAFAAIAAIASLQAGATVNEALSLKTEATQLQAQASDQWAYYQAKGIKAVVEDMASQQWQAAGKPVPEKIAADQQRHLAQQKDSATKATAFEKARDEKNAEAGHLIHRHHYFADAVALLQVGIALGAVAALTRKKQVWWGSLLLGLAGAVAMAFAYF
ncbi:DUF4337 domain-containing protein [Solilutibacter silvestris]|uniref:DUF4337 domain-containing protein n=1 Tax=Solilutibacter silvestris TaxID=1645665 RepID=A0A2K1PZM8_9GAMM|nr:DUF4337 domain-containing protein [Lysobacter silvestris]PNS08117.1 hypothetical protein Lysil_2293 [Lysobacter silvestris]